jgi:hypothetical protein
MDVGVLGIDLGKNSCSVVGLDPTGRVVLRRRMRRESIVGLAAKLSGCVVAMEACCGAHHLGRLLAAQGHEVRLMSPEYVRPYVKAQKNDDRDAEAIAANRSDLRRRKLAGGERGLVAQQCCPCRCVGNIRTVDACRCSQTQGTMKHGTSGKVCHVILPRAPVPCDDEPLCG